MSSGAGSLKGGGVLGLALLAAVVVAPAAAQPGERAAPAVTCAMHSGSHRLVIHAHELRERFHIPRHLIRHLSARDRRRLHQLERLVQRTPAEIGIERRIDEITVLDRTSSPFGLAPGYDDDESPLRSCGSPPSVDAVDSVAIELGKHAESADLHLDLRYGMLAPGATDEGDGGSEIEIEARLGTGAALVDMTRGADSVLARRPANARRNGPTTVNLNAAEAAPDADLEVGHHSLMFIGGGGGDDLMTASGGASGHEDDFGVLLNGGQGDDTLIGGDGSDGLIDSAGDDRIKAGPGTDEVISLGHGRDHVDCGPGLDLALVTSLDGVRHCEQAFTPEDLDLDGFDVEQVEPGKLRRDPGALAQLRKLADRSR